MAKITFNKLGCKVNTGVKEWEYKPGVTIPVLQYLPVEDKANLIQFVISQAIDTKSGCFSPVRKDVFFNIALARWYAGIQFSEKQMQDVQKTYDALESNRFFEALKEQIPFYEYDKISDYLIDTMEDVERYNQSFVGMMDAMSGDAQGLDSQISSILSKIKNSEGLEQLSVIKDVVGTD